MKQNARRLRAVVHNVARRPAVINGSRGFLPPRMAREDARQCFAARILCGAGYAVTSPGCRRAPLSPLGQPRGWSVARRIHSIRAWRSAGVSDETRAPRGAPSRRFQSPGPCFRARRGQCSPALIREPYPRRVQPFKAAPHSEGGRPPEASRERGYEPRPQAPHPAPSSRRLATTPSAEPNDRESVPSSRADAPEFLAGAGIRRAIHERSPRRVLPRLGIARAKISPRRNAAKLAMMMFQGATAIASRLPGRKPCVRRRGSFPKR